MQWAKTTRCDKSAVSMRLGQLAGPRGVVERDGNGRWRLAGVNPTMPPSLSRAEDEAELGARRHRMPAMANSYRGVDFARRAVASSARAVPRKEGNGLGCSVWVDDH